MSNYYRLIIISLLIGSLPQAFLSCRSSEGNIQRNGDASNASSRPGKTLLKVDTATIWVEVADRPEIRQVGLMFRRSLPQDEGMLFVFEEPQMLDFWMKNTYIPLDIAFISSDGEIVNIEAMKPLDEGPRYRSKRPARYALEVNQGWFAGKGIKPGHRIRF